MPWPSIADFTAAVQNPAVCFQGGDPELAAGQVGLHPARGTPLVYSGNFAAVYSVECSGGRKYAVRCFTREVKDQQERYGHLDDYLSGVRPDAFVRFQYHEQGIQIRGEWYPIVKMTWVEGRRLDRFVEDNLSRPEVILDICARWRGANGSLRGLGIAHNDLQHGNVMVQQDDALRLVDYDGIFLPRFQGEPSPELGHQHYQHPLRTADDYNDQVDNFPALVIYLSLLALSHDPGLWQRFYTQENLLLTKKDYADPANSQCFHALKSNPDATVRHLAGFLEECCSRPLEEVQDLESVLADAPSVTAASSVSAQAAGAGPPAPAAPVVSAPQPPTGLSYRSLLQGGQSPQPAPAATANSPTPVSVAPPQSTVASPVMTCPQCNLANPVELVYCDDEGCASVLYPGNRFCAYCGESIPVNGNYCPECGSRLV